MIDERRTQADLVAEATAIVSGQTMRLPEKAHLEALAAQMESVLQNNKLLTGQ